MQSVKCVAVGDGAVGKTCLFFSFTTNSFPKEYVPSVFEQYTLNCRVDGEMFCMGLWDTAGQEDFEKNIHPISPEQVYSSTDVFLLCFSVVWPASYESIQTKWADQMKRLCPSAKLLVVGLKTDLRQDERVVNNLARKGLAPLSVQKGRQLAREVGAERYVECSSICNTGVRDVFEEAVRCCVFGPKMEKEKKRIQKRNRMCVLL
mmetsp:Transcript_16529/g.25698  ORF Transcript_16529/g.25698 Transcript_16529/m.25698 type:complete len:205 (-) Transcript_16529:169-783(-)